MPVTTTTVTTRQTTSSPGVAVHTISFKGLAGAIFVVLASAAILYVIGFSTVGWEIHTLDTHPKVKNQHGLWESCTCRKHDLREKDWFKATQAMITIGLIGLLVSMILACLYLCVHTISKNSTILALVIVCFITVIFMLIGVLIFGIERGEHVSWSFALTVIAMVLTLVAGILAVVQMRKSGVHV